LSLPERSAQKRLEVVCPQCGSIFPAWAADIKRGRMKHCSSACSGASRRSKAHVEFRGESYYVNRHGYYISATTGRSLNRAVWEAAFGPVPQGHKVYVKDGVRSNYSLENLFIRKLIPRPGCRIAGCTRKAWSRGLCQPCRRVAKSEGVETALLRPRFAGVSGGAE